VGLRNTSLGVDEGSALSDLHRKADKQLEDERRREAEAKMYWEEKKKQEQVSHHQLQRQSCCRSYVAVGYVISGNSDSY